TAHSQPSRHDRAQPVRSHNYPGPQRQAMTAALAHHHAGYCPLVIQQLLRLGPFLYYGAGPAGSTNQDGVQNGPGNGEAERTGDCPAVETGEPSLDGSSIRRDDAHAVQTTRRGALDLQEDVGVEALQDGCGGGTQVLGARLVAGERRAIDHEDGDSRTC